jgi:hypothetical protein
MSEYIFHFVPFASSKSIAPILLSNLGTRFCLRGVGCDALGFQPGLLTLVNRVDFGQTTVNLVHHLKNIPDNP